MSQEESLRRPIGWWLKEADRRLDTAFDQVLAGHDVGRRDWQVLAMLAGSPTPRSDIVAALAAFDEPAVVDSVVDGLRSRGWVEESHGRMHLSQVGARHHSALAPLVGQVRDQVAAALPGDEYATLVRLLARLVTALPEPAD